mgnify:FL=1
MLICLIRHLEDYAHKYNTAKELEEYVTSDVGKTFWTPKLIVLGGVFTSDNFKNSGLYRYTVKCFDNN